MKPISTRTHGVLDYATAVVLLALPRVFGWNGRVTRFLTFMSLFLLGYSTFTRYELGIFKQIPVQGHLSLDAASGLLMTASPAFLGIRDPFVKTILTGLGLYELGASIMTDPNEAPGLPAQSSKPFAVPLDVGAYIRN